jgi:Putative adhesin
MSNQEIGRAGTEERPIEEPQAAGAPVPTTPSPSEQPVRQAAQPPLPPPYAPYARPVYYPGPGPQPVYGPYYRPPYGPPPRRRSPWPWIVLAVILVLAFTGVVGMVFAAIGNNLTGFTSTQTETRHFTVTTAPTVVINNDTGNLRVRAGSTSSDVAIQASKHAWSGSNFNDVQVSYSQSSDAKTITVNVNRSTGFTFFNSPSVDFEVTVPANTALQLKTNTGSIEVSDVSGQMTLGSDTGSVTMRDGALTSDSTLRSNTGSITFNGSIGKTGSYQFMTNTGSVNVTLPASSVFHVDATTNTGSITTDFSGVTVQHPNLTSAAAHGDVGSSPQATVTLSTNTGSINLRQS